MAAGLSSVVVVSGCSTTSSTPGVTSVASRPAASNDLASIQTKRIGEGVVTGAIVGGVAAGLFTALAGGNSRQIAQNTAIGVAVGAAGGAIFSAAVNKSASQHAAEQDRYRKVITDADANIASYKRATSSASAIASAEQQRIAQLNQKLAAGEITAAGYRSQLSSARGNVAAIDRLISSANSDINDMTTLIGSTGNNELKNRKADLVRQKDALTERRRLLMQAYDRVPPAVGLRV